MASVFRQHYRLALQLIGFAVAYCVAYGLGRLLYLEPTPVSALWPASGLALGALLCVERRWWPLFLTVQGICHLALGWFDASSMFESKSTSAIFAAGVTIANVIEIALAAWLVHTWCSGVVRLSAPAHIARLFGAAILCTFLGALIGGITVTTCYGSGDFFTIARTWMLADFIGILVLTPAVIALRSLRDEFIPGHRVEISIASLTLIIVTVLIAYETPGESIILQRPALVWIPLLWLGARAGPGTTAIAAAIAALFLVGGTNLGKGPFILGVDNAAELSLSVQIFVGVLCAGTLLIASSANGYRLAFRHIAASADRLRTTLASIGDGVISTDAAGKVELINPVACTLTGWTEHQAVGRPLSEIFKITSSLTGEPVTNPIDHSLRDGAINILANHTELHHRDGSKRKIADSGAPIRSPQGSIIGAVLVFRDISERYALEERLRQTEKLEAIGRLSSGIAHDLNNMLGGVIGGADLLQRYVKDDVSSMKAVHMIMTAAERMREINARLLSFARYEPATHNEEAIDDVLTNCIDLLSHALPNRVQLISELNAPNVIVSINHGQIESAILNLAINARDAMPTGGRLRIATEIRTRDDSKEVAIIVQDHGTGMTPEVQARIFEPFFTTKPAGLGTGLGLHAAQSCVRAHNGTIAIDSTVDVGTTITITLPVIRIGKTESPTPTSYKKLVLVVDDDSSVRQSTTVQLQELGYQVITAEDGVDGYACLQQYKFGLVVLDVIMPRMDGIELLRLIRDDDPSLPVLLVSGQLPDGTLKDVFDRGPTQFLNKPFRLADLQRAIKQLGASIK